MGVDRKCSVLCIPAAKIIGVPSKKENLAALVGDKFAKSPAEIVIPDREVPGKSAIA